MEMKKIGMKMSLFMGLTLSFFLSLTGNLTSGHFTVPGFLISFVISTIISLIIGFLVPMQKVTGGFDRKHNLDPAKFSTKCINSLISDLIYTPVITFCMVAMAHHNAVSHGQQMPPLWLMFLKSLIISMIIGFVLVYIFTPLYLKLVTKNMPRPEQHPEEEEKEHESVS